MTFARWPLVLALAGAPAWAAGDVGVGLDLGGDLPDALGATLAPGFGLRVPVRWRLAPSVAVRGTGQVFAAAAQDRVEWTAGGVRLYSDDHWSMLTSTHLLAGPELSLPQRPLRPWLGVDVGLAWAQNWHSFGGDTAVLLDPTQNDLDNPRNIDPFSSALRPAAGLHLGFGIPLSLPFALEVEAGYVVSFLSTAALRKSGPELDAVRAPFGLNPLRLGAAVTFPFGPRP